MGEVAKETAIPRRARFTIRAADVESIICCRQLENSGSQFLVLWKGDPVFAPLSWHGLGELSSCLHLVQDYLSKLAQVKEAQLLAVPVAQTLKRKSPHDEARLSIPTPVSIDLRSRSPSIISISSSEGDKTRLVAVPAKAPLVVEYGSDVYNAHFQRREGTIVVVPSPRPVGVTIDVRTMPQPDMIAAALHVDTTDAERVIRQRYIAHLNRIPGPKVSFHNDYNRDTPPLAYRFIDNYVFRNGIKPLDREKVGCKRCRPHMGQGRGCEYTRLCDCLEEAAVDVARMTEDHERIWAERKTRGDPSTEGLPKRFPYLATGYRAGCLVDFYLQSRNPIYECNEYCACGPDCKNRNVQHGRKVKLQIFRTNDGRGFGLRSPQPLQKGQFIDTYLGEVISDGEAERRENAALNSKQSYLFALDKHVGDHGIETVEDCHVVDGQFMGGPTRFINHCCEPNVRLHTVSYNKKDLHIYDLAFFALEDLEAYTELTFDYLDQDDPEEAARQNDTLNEAGKTKTPCHCGAARCRGFLWT